MAATIAPGRLLGTLKVLLSPSGGIKSHQEVGRLVSLMQKFSRKLVSKVIYIHILTSSTPKLLEAFLVGSGWDLLSAWLSRAVISTNWPLVSELLDLLALCPPPPLPTRQALQNLLLSIQVQNLQLSTLSLQIISKWSQTGIGSKCLIQASSNLNSTLPKTVGDFSEGSPLQDSTMTLSRRCKRTVIVTNPHVVANTTSPASGAMVVTFQEQPLQNIVDVFKLQRRRGREDIETQVWRRQVGTKRKNERENSQNTDERNKKDARLSSLVPRREECRFEDLSAAVYGKFSKEKSDEVESSMTRSRGSSITSIGTSVSVVNDEGVTQIENLHNEDVEDDVDEEANPLKIFEDISNELKENLMFEKHIAIKQVVKRGRIGGNIWGMNKNENVTGFEGGSAKDYRLARREKFREEQKLLEEQNEVQERKDREVKRERMKKVKREEDRKAKMAKEMEEKRRKMEIEGEERKKREKTEAEFKKRREGERLRRKEKERQERNLGSMKSELKDGLNSDEKSRIKLIAQQMKQISDTSDSTSRPVVQGRIPKFGKVVTSDQTEVAQVSKPAKPLFSVAKNKNKDLLASLEAPLQPSKRPQIIARDPLLKKSVPPLIPRKLQLEPRLLDYGIKSLALDMKMMQGCEDYVSSMVMVKDVIEEVKVDAPNKVSQQDDINLEDLALVKVVESASATSIEQQESVSDDKNEVKCKYKETGHSDYMEDLKNTSVEKKVETKENRHIKTEVKKKVESSHDEKKSHEDKKTKKINVNKSDSKEGHAKKSKEGHAKKSKDGHAKKSDSKEGHDMKSTSTKPPLTLKPVSQLKESSLFGSLLENVEKSSQKKKRKTSSLGIDHNKNSKYSKTEKDKSKDDPASSKFPPAPVVAVATVPRRVSGILIVERGSALTKRSVKWRSDEELVQVEYFQVDAAERVNVHKLKFEEVRQQEREKERSLLSKRHNSMEKEADENPWKGLRILDNCGRGNFKAGGKSGEKELQRMREERVLPIVCFGNIPMNPSEPDIAMNRNIFGVGTTRDILVDDISGEGTEVDYGAEGWPEPSGAVPSCYDGIGPGQFYGGGEALIGQVDPGHGHGSQEHSRYAGEGVGQRFPSSQPHSRGFGRGVASGSWATRGFRGGFDARGRGGFGGKRNFPCKYWRRGSCRDGQDCKFLHI